MENEFILYIFSFALEKFFLLSFSVKYQTDHEKWTILNVDDDYNGNLMKQTTKNENKTTHLRENFQKSIFLSLSDFCIKYFLLVRPYFFLLQKKKKVLKVIYFRRANKLDVKYLNVKYKRIFSGDVDIYFTFILKLNISFYGQTVYHQRKLFIMETFLLLSLFF